jgi:aryl-alcohol dehydrogenase-like predicted oxidoreductase
MKYSSLGSTELEISKIGLGCWAIGGHGYGPVEKKEAIRAVLTAFDLGINFFDTADVYGFGRSEEILSEALGKHRHRVVIATKFGVGWTAEGKTYKDCTREIILHALEGSLRRLKLQTIPLYQVHWWDGITAFDEIIETLKECQKAGKIRFFGCTNFSLEMIHEAQKSGRISSIQSAFNMLERENENLLRTCFFEHGMGTIAYSVLARGFFSGKYHIRSYFGKDDTRAKEIKRQKKKAQKMIQVAEQLKTIGLSFGKSPSQIAIKWVIDNPFITTAIVGAKNGKQVAENVAVFDWDLPPEHKKILTMTKDNLPNETK